MIFSVSGCNKTETKASSEETAYKIGIVTPSLSTSEDEFRAAENMVTKYPGVVEYVVLPEDFNVEIETAISQITSLADDPAMKAIVVVSGQSGLLPALQKVKEKNSDILTVTATKTFIYYSFPTHLAKEAISKRKDMMKSTCESLILNVKILNKN